jgi:malonyl-CoA decarboxylase
MNSMSDVAVQPGLLDRALRRVSSLWRDMGVSGGRAAASFTEPLRECLEGRGGEVSARTRTAKLAEVYLAADHAGRDAFLRALARLDSDSEAVAKAMAGVAAAGADDEARAAAKARLRRVLEPPRLKLLTQFTTIPDGMKFLVDLRAELLQRSAGDAMLTALDADLRGQLAAWFDVGFLELRRIDWTSPASLLEKLVGYEAVHRIRTWRDLKNRLDSDRRCYAFFHPRMPEEPLIFVEVALVRGMAGTVRELLDEKAPVLDPRGADTAIFYSINNCQRGLDGISFGNFLIKRVVSLLSDEFRNLKSFATLSPVPGFSRWLGERFAAGETGLLSEEEGRAISAALPLPTAIAAPGAPALPPDAEAKPETPEAVLRRVLAKRHWMRNEALSRAVEPVLMRLCARYLAIEEAPGRPGRARDPVAHFHLSNGARIERLNWRGDVSEKGLKESAGLMVNYLYDPAKIEDYHEGYAGEGKRPMAAAMRKLAKG